MAALSQTARYPEPWPDIAGRIAGWDLDARFPIMATKDEYLVSRALDTYHPGGEVAGEMEPVLGGGISIRPTVTP